MENNKHKIITFGKILGRLSPPNNLRFSQATNFEVNYGGEFNVAASLVNYGITPALFKTTVDVCLGAIKITSKKVDYFNGFKYWK